MAWRACQTDLLPYPPQGHRANALRQGERLASGVEDVDPIVQREIGALSGAHGIAGLYVFGSRAAEIAAAVRNGSAPDVESTSRSDVDVGGRPLPSRDFDLDAVVKMTGALECVLDVPRVDIVVLPRANPFLALDVIPSGVREMLEQLRALPLDSLAVFTSDPRLAGPKRCSAHVTIPAPSTCSQLRTFEETPCTLALDGGMDEHPNKHIREAIGFAIGAGWRLRRSSARAHTWGLLLCPHAARSGCRLAVYSTPRSPEDHAGDIRRAVRRCPHERDLS